MEYTITFFAAGEPAAEIVVSSVETVRAIVLSGANVSVEWNGEWGDAVAGEAVTESLYELIHS